MMMMTLVMLLLRMIMMMVILLMRMVMLALFLNIMYDCLVSKQYSDDDTAAAAFGDNEIGDWRL